MDTVCRRKIPQDFCLIGVSSKICICGTVVSYQNERFLSKWELPFCSLLPSQLKHRWTRSKIWEGGAVSFPEGGCQFFLSGGINPPSTQNFFRLRHLLLFKVVRPPVINLRCSSYSLALHLQIVIWLKGFDPYIRVRCKFNG